MVVSTRRSSSGKALRGAKPSSSSIESHQTGAAPPRCARLASSSRRLILVKAGRGGAHVVRVVSGCCRGVLANSMFRHSDDKTARVHDRCCRRKKTPTSHTPRTHRPPLWAMHSGTGRQMSGIGILRHAEPSLAQVSSPHSLLILWRCGHHESIGAMVRIQ